MERNSTADSGDIAPSVAVCITTYRRPEGLRRLLSALDEQKFTRTAPKVEVVVIDNDAGGSARTVCEERFATSRLRSHYDIEPLRGIPQARNKSVAYAAPRCDLIAFIDDDEVPTPDWLEKLISAQRAYKADVVAGPVLSVLPSEAPSWIARGGHFDHVRYGDGQPIGLAASGNVLIKSDVFQSVRPHFDERLAYSGGSDSLFFQRLHLAGYKMVWADEAVVREWVPASRATLGWLIRRAYRHGTTFAQRTISLYPAWRAVPRLLYRAALHMAAGILLLPIGLLRGKHAWAMHLRYLAYAGGVIGGMFGGRYEEYRRTHGC